MAEITTELIKSLRDQTGVSVMQCKKALEETGGDVEKALLVLRKNSAAQALKKADRTLGAGLIHAYIHSNKQVGVLLELNCETDFVAKNDDFQQLASDIAMHIAAMAPEYVSETDIAESTRTGVIEMMERESADLDKPAEIKAKIIEGKINDYFAQRTLVKQAFIKNPDITIGTLIDQAVQKIGEKIEVGRFTYYSLLAR